jgi:hypothetical protein
MGSVIDGEDASSPLGSIAHINTSVCPPHQCAIFRRNR